MVFPEYTTSLVSLSFPAQTGSLVFYEWWWPLGFNFQLFMTQSQETWDEMVPRTGWFFGFQNGFWVNKIHGDTPKKGGVNWFKITVIIVCDSRNRFLKVISS